MVNLQSKSQKTKTGKVRGCTGIFTLVRELANQQLSRTRDYPEKELFLPPKLFSQNFLLGSKQFDLQDAKIGDHYLPMTLSLSIISSQQNVRSR